MRVSNYQGYPTPACLPQAPDFPLSFRAAHPACQSFLSRPRDPAWAARFAGQHIRPTTWLHFVRAIEPDFQKLVNASPKTQQAAYSQPRREPRAWQRSPRQSDPWQEPHFAQLVPRSPVPASHGIGKDHRIPLAELKCMSPKRVKELDLYLGLGRAARRRGEEPGRAREIKSAHGRRPLFRPGP